METVNLGSLEWGVASSVLPGESQSGDHYVVCAFPDGVLVAVVDGLRHGEQAAEAAMKAVDVLEASAQEPVIALVRRCHEKLMATRGVVRSVGSLSISYRLTTWLGVGNVQGTLRPSRRQ